MKIPKDYNYEHNEKMSLMEIKKSFTKKQLEMTSKEVQSAHKVQSQLFVEKHCQVMRLRLNKKNVNNKEVRQKVVEYSLSNKLPLRDAK